MRTKARHHFAAATVGVAAAVIVGWSRGQPASSPPATSAPSAGVVAASTMPALAHPTPEPRPRVIVRQRDVEPSAPGYDAIRLGVDEELTPREVFEREPRDDAFAIQQERALQRSVAEVADRLAVASGIREVRIECRTLSCKATITIDPEKGDHVYDALNGIPFGPVRGVSSPEDVASGTRSLELVLLFKPGHRDARVFRQWQERVLWPRVEREIARAR